MLNSSMYAFLPKALVPDGPILVPGVVKGSFRVASSLVHAGTISSELYLTRHSPTCSFIILCRHSAHRNRHSRSWSPSVLPSEGHAGHCEAHILRCCLRFAVCVLVFRLDLRPSNYLIDMLIIVDSPVRLYLVTVFQSGQTVIYPTYNG